MKSKEKRNYKKECHSQFMGFTLIELLVVVLIIGILAAVTVPQYRVAVEKSRIASDLAILRALANARQVYRLATGDVNCNLEELDVEFPYVEKQENDAKPYGCGIKQIEYTLANGHKFKLATSMDAIVLASGDDYVIDYYTYGIDGASGECYGINDFGERICKQFGEYYRTIGKNRYRFN